MSEAKSELHADTHTHTHTHTHAFHITVANLIPTLRVSYDLFCLLWFKNSYCNESLKSGVCMSFMLIHVPHICVPACMYHICHLHATLHKMFLITCSITILSYERYNSYIYCTNYSHILVAEVYGMQVISHIVFLLGRSNTLHKK
jgi:hypothetical protein